MSCNDRGMALVSVILLLTVLLILTQILVEKVWQSTHRMADADYRDRLFWAAQTGIEEARKRLALNYASSGGWQTFLTAGVPRTYPENPAWVIDENEPSVEIYLRDNPDGDNDLYKDNDLKIYVLARARGHQGAEIMIESLCGFEPPESGYAPHVTGTLNGTGTGPGLTDMPVSNDEISD